MWFECFPQTTMMQHKGSYGHLVKDDPHLVSIVTLTAMQNVGKPLQ